MKTEENLKDLAKSIIDSYEMRVKTVNDLMEQEYHFLEGFHAELQEMIVQLKENLAKSESLRRKDFDRRISFSKNVAEPNGGVLPKKMSTFHLDFFLLPSYGH